MTEQEARDLCARLSAEHPDRDTHQWLAVQRDGEWRVAKIGLPPADEHTVAEVRSDERPATPDDPRPPWRNPYNGYG
jgi:hypothetical protein